MAIQKSKTLTNGSTGNYFKITKTTVDKQAMTVTCILSLFTDAAHTATSPLDYTKVFKNTATKQQLSGDILALCYTNIKAKNDPDLTGGTDV